MLALFLVDSCFFKNVDYVDTRKYQENLREIKFPHAVHVLRIFGPVLFQGGRKLGCTVECRSTTIFVWCSPFFLFVQPIHRSSWRLIRAPQNTLSKGCLSFVLRFLFAWNIYVWVQTSLSILTLDQSGSRCCQIWCDFWKDLLLFLRKTSFFLQHLSLLLRKLKGTEKCMNFSTPLVFIAKKIRTFWFKMMSKVFLPTEISCQKPMRILDTTTWRSEKIEEKDKTQPRSQLCSLADETPYFRPEETLLIFISQLSFHSGGLFFLAMANRRAAL